MALLVAPSLCRLQKLCAKVDKVDRDGLYRLFEACTKLNDASFTVTEYMDLDNALDCFA